MRGGRDALVNLPPLAYIADVPVEASYHGSALLHRLLHRYPAERLRVLETTMHDSQPARRLPSVAYGKLDVGAPRPLHTRAHRFVNDWYTLRASSRSDGIAPLLGEFSPRAVLSVVHGYGWLAAARFAGKRSLPLHLIIHDDWPRQSDLHEPIRRGLDRRFGDVYRQAASRLCVSPYMEENYRTKYGVAGSVLLPSRAPDAQQFASPPDRLRETGRPLVFGYGGTINTPGYADALRRLAAALSAIGARLNIYGPIEPSQAAAARIGGPQVALRGLVPASEFIARMREEVDVLFLPISFDAPDRENMRLCFPSKLTDYTAAGLPILAYGPADASGIRWAREGGAAEVVDSQDGAALQGALQRLVAAQYRHELALAALRRGEEDFSHAAAETAFFSHIARASA